jgi:hypothetical protein
MMIRVNGLVVYVKLGDFVWGHGWGKELVLQLGTVLHKIEVQFLPKVILFCILFMLVLFLELGCTLVIFS